MVLTTFNFCEGSVNFNKVGCQPHRGEESFHLSHLHPERCVQGLRLQPMPQRQDPAAFPPVINVPTPAAEPVAAFARHAVADSSAQVPCTMSERAALTKLLSALVARTFSW